MSILYWQYDCGYRNWTLYFKGVPELKETQKGLLMWNAGWRKWRRVKKRPPKR